MTDFASDSSYSEASIKMSESGEYTDSDVDVDAISDGFKKLKALPCPETCVEIPRKITPPAKPAPDSNQKRRTRKDRHQFLNNSPSPKLPIEPKAVEHEMWDPNTDTPKEINILLLGESGVGKSTFINSFANYMKHENFEAVQRNNLSVLIQARFNIFDKDFKKHLIEIGANDANEYLADGAAATQDVKTYVFYVYIENVPYMIRLIDTPGMGDPRGIDQDNKNCDYVLNYLGRLEKVHAICLLLKPTNTRLDVFLNYCVTQILSRLEKSATENISFLFTNTRGQNYTPGETYTSLEVLVRKIKDVNNVHLPLSKNNVFCFDNEAFRFLASIKENVEFREGILEANIESWKYSYTEVYRLLSYIVALKPHDPKKTISINHARKMVLQLSQPLAEIVQLIGDNIYELDQHTKQLLVENQSLEQLKQKLHMPVIDIKAMELSQPVTVCTSPNCSAIYKVAGKNKFHYKQRCHNPCYLNNVPAEIVGDPHLLHCTAMHGTSVCQECNCRYNTHMHIYYETETFENKIVDENVLKNINTKEDAAKEKQRIINEVLNRKEEFEKEHTTIIKCSAAFAHFLQRNAITPINDSLKEYVKYLISRQENLGPSANKETLDYLRKLLAEYEQEKAVLEEALKLDTASNVIFDNSPNAIEKKIQELFTLHHFGKKIKLLYDLHQSGGKIEHKQTEFIVREKYKISNIIKSVGNSIMSVIGYNKKSQKENQNSNVTSRQMELEQSQYFRGIMTRQEMEALATLNPNMYQGNPWQDQSFFFGNSNSANAAPYLPRPHEQDQSYFYTHQNDYHLRQLSRNGQNWNDNAANNSYYRNDGQENSADDPGEYYRLQQKAILDERDNLRGNTATRRSFYDHQNKQHNYAKNNVTMDQNTNTIGNPKPLKEKQNSGDGECDALSLKGNTAKRGFSWRKNEKARKQNSNDGNGNSTENSNKKYVGKKKQKAIQSADDINSARAAASDNQEDDSMQIVRKGKKNKKKKLKFKN
ncbi:unnamed protein product [Ceutorhynchus assimilis]|uniref:DUF8206 domain-containing protein n=1 Tax=Ceutorhynchus assimilis TaxID=467358 RepID=A0A9N9MSN6_9CUCU|nr:unnamed protein product [Ceutorhynchus assimilis]